MEINDKKPEAPVETAQVDTESDLIFPGWLRLYEKDPSKDIEYMEWAVDSFSVVP